MIFFTVYAGGLRESMRVIEDARRCLYELTDLLRHHQNKKVFAKVTEKFDELQPLMNKVFDFLKDLEKEGANESKSYDIFEDILILMPWDECIAEYRGTTVGNGLLCVHLRINGKTVHLNFVQTSKEAKIVQNALKHCKVGRKVSILKTNLRYKPILVKIL